MINLSISRARQKLDKKDMGEFFLETTEMKELKLDKYGETKKDR